MRALSIGATGMQAQQLNVEVISNNIANLTTSGYKRQRAEFQDLLYENIRRPGATSSDTGTIVPSGVQLGAGVRAGAVYRINQQGALQITDNPLDVAINGEGYFQVQLPSGDLAYTRAGSFQLNANGEIVTLDGYRIQGPGAVPGDAKDILINENGTVSAKIDGQTEPTEVGQIAMSIFANPAGLEAVGNNLFLVTPASGEAQDGVAATPGYGVIEQGALETSNVNAVTEITDLITAQRAYDMNSKVIRTADEMLNTVNQLR